MSSEIKVEGIHSQMRILRPASVEGQKILLWPASGEKGRRLQRTFCFCCFLKSKEPHFEVVCVDSSHYLHAHLRIHLSSRVQMAVGMEKIPWKKTHWASRK